MRIAVVVISIALVLAACGGAGEQEAGRAELRIVNLNVLHGVLDEDPAAQPFDRLPERLPLIASAIADANADVVLLQEVVLEGDGYPDIRAGLRDALGDEYAFVFGDIAGRPVGEGTLGQLTMTRWPVLSSENRNVSDFRTALRVTIETDAGPIAIYNVHLEGSGAGDVATLAEIEAVLAFVEATRDGAPAIVGGDFNAQPDDISVRAMVDAGFVDTLAMAGESICDEPGDSGCSASTLPLGDNPDRNASRRIDYIFVSAGFELVSASTFLDEPASLANGGLLWASNHIGMQADVEVEGR